MAIATLDFDHFQYGTQIDQANFCRDFIHALSEFGFVKLKNHGIPKDIIQAAFSWSQKFFNLPVDVKMRVAHPKEANPHRGYSYIGQEKLSRVAGFEKGQISDQAILDIKESLDLGPSKDELYPNRWFRQSELPGFQEFMEDYYERCQQVHIKLLEVLAISFGLPKLFFVRYCCQNTSELRLNSYPATTRSTLWSGCNRISEHTDFGTFTLLFQDSVGGLEIEDQDHYGNFLPIQSDDITEMIVNIGDCLQRWTNDMLRSANHRVTLPPTIRQGDSEIVNHRYSIAYFGKPNREAPVRTMSEFVRSGTKPKYAQEMTMWEYNQVKLLRTY